MKKPITGKRKQTLRVSKGGEIEQHNDQGSGRESRSGRLFQSMLRGFKDETTKIESQGKRVTDRHRFCSVAQSETRRSLEMSASLSGIAALVIRLPAHAQMPDLRIDLSIARESDGTIRQCQ